MAKAIEYWYASWADLEMAKREDGQWFICENGNEWQAMFADPQYVKRVHNMGIVEEFETPVILLFGRVMRQDTKHFDSVILPN